MKEWDELIDVSIHVPLAEHDVVKRSFCPTLKFQFTCPSRSTTQVASSISRLT